MSALYSLTEKLRVRSCPEVQTIVARIRDHCETDFDVELAPTDAGGGRFSIDGAAEFAAGGVSLLEELLISLGPFTREGDVLSGQYDGEPCELVVGSTEEACSLALSCHRLEQIRSMARELVARDRRALVAWLQEPCD
jgi:hypothetical protein